MALMAVTGGFASMASGGAPMGLPRAYVGEGQWAVGVEYGREQGDLQAYGRVEETLLNGSSFFWTQPFEMLDLGRNMIFGTIAHGICENWDIFGRVGVSDAKDELVARQADSDAVERRDDFDGGFGLAWGAGTRATFCRTGPWSFGALAQITWFRPGESDFTVADPLIPDESWVGEAELDYWQAQASVAAMYQIDRLHLWAGPFLQFVRGDLDFDGSAVLAGAGVSTIRASTELQESSQFGAHFGAHWEMSDAFNLWVEGQLTEDSWLVGVGGVFVPEKSQGL
jgi:hypothetical protein